MMARFTDQTIKSSYQGTGVLRQVIKGLAIIVKVGKKYYCNTVR